MTVTIPSTHTLERPPLSHFGIAGREVRLSESLRLASVTERSQDITLRTREGDIVTLSMDQHTAAVYGRDGRLSLNRHCAADAEGHQTSYQGLTGGNRAWLGIASGREATLSIEGDLSRQEVRDIRKALHRIHRLIGQSFGANAEATPPRSGLAGLDTLAGIEVTIRQSRTVMAARSTRMSTASYGADGQISSGPDRQSAPQQPAWQTMAGKAADIVWDTGIDPTHFKQPLEHLFGGWSYMLRRRQDPWHNGLLKKIAVSLEDRLGLSPPDEGRRQWWTP